MFKLLITMMLATSLNATDVIHQEMDCLETQEMCQEHGHSILDDDVQDLIDPDTYQEYLENCQDVDLSCDDLIG